ncbi:transketolase family protein [Candidatus Saccharibacteria bacterium]|nr:transketolase family protein [Candidatus Saccharibacteria bacterium]MCL1963062.1 transketolase family protein [Candidatus Saccharibacteria bacterium]
MTYKLDEKILSGEPNQDSTRAGFGRGLVTAARNDENVVGLCADLTESVQMHKFAEEFPERFVEIGIAEQNLVTVASGMAHVGKIPFAASYAAFNPGRNWEQIRTTIALNDVPVKIIGSHAGLNVGPDGATHQMLEDIALMRVLPNMVVIAPGDAVEAEKVAVACARDSRPNYIRLTREKSPTFSASDAPFEIGRAYILREGSDVAICATGTMTAQALIAAAELEKQGISAEIIHVPTIKPLDETTILKSARKTGKVITVEEHQIAGGFGSAIAELLSERYHDVIPSTVEESVQSTKDSSSSLCSAQNDKFLLHRIGINDQFGQSGTAEELLKHYGLTAENIVSTAIELVQNRSN